MTDALWNWDELLKVVPFAVADGTPSRPITGFSIDTRSLQPGDVFVALKDQRDGHEFVTNAFKAGAAAAIVDAEYQRRPGDGALMRCKSSLHALEAIGIAARSRLSAKTRVIAVTGSAGKTTTKEMLRACLSIVAPGKVHASEKSYNNHWGVPLTLARMPADTQYALFEIGMNHAGEITLLSKMVRPHVAIVTTVESVHLEHFPNVDAIADAKGEIFSGLEPDGVAVIKRDSQYANRLGSHAHLAKARCVLFSLNPGNDGSAQCATFDELGSRLEMVLAGKRPVSVRVAMPGRHNAENATAVVAALNAVGADVEKAISALATLAPPAGRGLRTRLSVPGGEILLIDESYNANPASMRAALETLSGVARDKFPRRIVVLGDMLELGRDASILHKELKEAVTGSGADLFFACGPHMKGLYDALPIAMKGDYAEAASGLQASLITALRAGDVVMLKASNGTKLGPLVEAVKKHFSGASRSHEIGQ